MSDGISDSVSDEISTQTSNLVKILQYPAFPGDIPGNQSTDNMPFSVVIVTFALWPFRGVVTWSVEVMCPLRRVIRHVIRRALRRAIQRAIQ